MHTDQFPNLLETTVIKAMWPWYRCRHINPWNRIEGPEIEPQTYGQLIFNQGEDKSIKE